MRSPLIMKSDGLWCLVASLTLFICQDGVEAQCKGGRCKWEGVSSSNGLQQWYYDEATHTCHQLPTNCTISDVFDSKTQCEGQCVRQIGGCESTMNGCCEDNLTARDKHGDCPKDDEEANPGGGDDHSSSLPWDIIGAGICVLVIVIGTVSVVGIATYAYRHRNKQRQRRYIQEVLQMYDSHDGSSDSSDYSYLDDNPESNNLFDRL